MPVGYVLFLALLATPVVGHGMVTAPKKRGKGDTCGHCLNAGGPGAVGPWSPYEPLKGNKRTGFGICGDKAGANTNMKIGRYGSRNTAITNYKAGSVANFEFKVTANHRGYLEFYLCDVTNNPGQDIQFSTFPQDCVYLERVPNASCESGNDPDCGPIDPKFPGRWMFPCGSKTYGGPSGKMAYRIPNKEVKSANSCLSPDGFTGSYNYPSSWCKMGTPATCGGYAAPEEFWNCADVTVSGGSHNESQSSGKSQPTGAVTNPPQTIAASGTTVAPGTTVPRGPTYAPTTPERSIAQETQAVQETPLEPKMTATLDNEVDQEVTATPDTEIELEMEATPDTEVELEMEATPDTEAEPETPATQLH